MSVFNQNADSLNSNGANSGGVELDRLREALELYESNVKAGRPQAAGDKTIVAAVRLFDRLGTSLMLLLPTT